MSWLPAFKIFGTCIAESDWEAEGRVLQVHWGKWVFEISLCVIDRRFDDEPEQ